MTDLRQFGAVEDPPPPKCRRKVIVDSPTKDKLAGFICHEQRRDLRVYTTLRGYGTYYKNGGGFAISECILDLLADRNVSRMFIHDARGGGIEDGNVFEYTVREYRDGDTVSKYDREVDWDHQRVLSTAEARYTWEGLGNAMYVQPFPRACDRIGDRRVDPTPPEYR